MRRALLLALLLLGAVRTPCAVAGWRVETLAGGGVADGRPATAASLQPLDVLVDRATGDLYIADGDTNRIRKVDAATRTLSTVAGNGRAAAYPGAGGRGAFCGDGGPALEACLDLRHPREFYATARLGRGATGDLYVTDAGNHRLRRVAAATGRITTITGNDQLDDEGRCLMSRDGRRRRSSECLGVPAGVVAGDGGLYVANAGQVLRVNPRSGSTRVVAGRAGECAPPSPGGEDPLAACLPEPLALAVNGDALFIASPNGGVHRLDLGAATLTKVMSGAIGCATAPSDGTPAHDACAGVVDVAVDAAGNLFLATYGRAYRIDAATQTIALLAGNGFVDPNFEEGIYCGDGGPAVDACLNGVRAIDVDAAGNVFLADAGNGRVRRVDAVTREISTYAGGDTCDCDVAAVASESCVAPSGIALASDGRVVIANGDRICRVDLASQAMSVLVGGPGADLAAHAVATDAAGNVYLAEPFFSRVRRADAVTGALTVVAGDGHDGGSEPCLTDGVVATTTCLARPEGVAIAPDGALWIADTDHDRVRRVDPVTAFVSTVATVARPIDVTVEPSGSLLATERQKRVVRIDPASGAVTPIAGRSELGPPFPLDPFGIDQPAVASRLAFPAGSAADGVGNVYIADPFFFGLLRVDAVSGLLRRVADDGTMLDVVVDHDDRAIVADVARIRRVAPSAALAVQQLTLAPDEPRPGEPVEVRFEATLREAALADPATFLGDGLVLGITDHERAPLVFEDFYRGAWLSAPLAPSECRRIGRGRLACRRSGRSPVTLRVETLADGTGLRLRGTLTGASASAPIGLAIVLDRARLLYAGTLAP